MSTGPRALIAGLGLIGGSIGIALRRAGWHVEYVDPDVTPEAARGAADEVGSFDRDYDLTIIATPVDAALAVLGRAGSNAVTSVCSVMQPLRAAAGARRFVAGHPLAGSAQRGIAAASGDLFRGKRWFVDGDEAFVDRVISDCGAIRERVEAAEHDVAVALTSHLPQILSTALAAHLQREGVDPKFAGSGLATFLRLAESDASVWRPIIDANRGAIEPHLQRLTAIVKAILAGDDDVFRDAQTALRRLVSSAPR